MTVPVLVGGRDGAPHMEGVVHAIHSVKDDSMRRAGGESALHDRRERVWAESEAMWGALRVLLLRGRFAVPRFDVCDVGDLLRQRHSQPKPTSTHSDEVGHCSHRDSEVDKLLQDGRTHHSPPRADWLAELGLHMSDDRAEAEADNSWHEEDAHTANTRAPAGSGDDAHTHVDPSRTAGKRDDVGHLFPPTRLTAVPSRVGTTGWESGRCVTTGTRVLPVPLSATMRSWLRDTRTSRRLLRRTGGGRVAQESMDAIWAAYREAAHNTESFRVARVASAASVQDLPVNQLTLEQRLQQQQTRGGVGATTTTPLSALPPLSDHAASHNPSVGGGGGGGALGLATVPLYQALHADDVTAVVELLSLAAVASPRGMYDTARSLQLPYCLQLLQLLSRRLGVISAPAARGEASVSWMGGGLAATSLQSSLLAWVDALVECRGVEMYRAQCASQEQQNESAAAALSPAPISSPPRDFLAPLLHQYRQYNTQYDKLATLYGRLSVFTESTAACAATARKAKSSQRVGDFFNKPRAGLGSNMEMARTPATLSRKMDLKGVLQDDILFPAMFTEVRTRRGGRGRCGCAAAWRSKSDSASGSRVIARCCTRRSVWPARVVCRRVRVAPRDTSLMRMGGPMRWTWRRWTWTGMT